MLSKLLEMLSLLFSILLESSFHSKSVAGVIELLLDTQKCGGNPVTVTIVQKMLSKLHQMLSWLFSILLESSFQSKSVAGVIELLLDTQKCGGSPVSVEIVQKMLSELLEMLSWLFKILMESSLHSKSVAGVKELLLDTQKCGGSPVSVEIVQ